VSGFLAGDLHHYRRHAAADGTQKITSGGGGAFLHPTHGADVERIEERDDHGRPTGRTFAHQRSWPDPATSQRLCWRNLAFSWWNPFFGLVPGAIYALLAWSLRLDFSDARSVGAVLERVWTMLPERPSAVVWIAAIVGGFILFTDTHSAWYRRIAGPLHGLTHLVGALAVIWAATYFTVAVLGLSLDRPWPFVVAGVLVFAGGWLVGALILGLYLLVSLNVSGRHANEAFSALRIEDWKPFLRLRIGPDGPLTIFPIGLRRVPRRWVARAGAVGPTLEPAPGSEEPPVLIEDPIVVRRQP